MDESEAIGKHRSIMVQEKRYLSPFSNSSAESLKNLDKPAEPRISIFIVLYNIAIT